MNRDRDRLFLRIEEPVRSTHRRPTTTNREHRLNELMKLRQPCGGGFRIVRKKIGGN